MKGVEQLARRGRPLARRGSRRASEEIRARGQRALFLEAYGLQASAVARSPLAQQPPLQRHPVTNNTASYQPFPMCACQRRDIHSSRLQTHDALWSSHALCLPVPLQFGPTKSC